MDINLMNNTKTSNLYISPTLIWCLLMPLIHLLSLISNIFCIIIFCSKTFIHKPIAIYFICLLISDSTTLLIGYSEMVERELFMRDKSSLLCIFNDKIIHNLTDFVYTFMGKFCLEWILYKILWTRASTILLAILSIQRSRTFFSLSYHETRFCAIFACISSLIIAILITCFEWIGIQCSKPNDSNIYIEIFQLIKDDKPSKKFYSKYLHNNYDELIDKYYCIFQSLSINRSNITISKTDQFNCSNTTISSEFYNLTQSLLSNRNSHISDIVTNILTDVYINNINLTNTSILFEQLSKTQSSDILLKLFEKRSCQITLIYTIYFKIYDFLHSLSFSFNRHTVAIFFGHALPSFIVFLANILSLKIIYFSTNLKYLKRTTSNNHHKNRLKNDLRAFLVILIESFSVITISWGIPIFLTMYHCHTLYVVSISSCPQIKQSLALFLYTDLFNSSTNSLLYSLSGKLFRRKYISILKIIFTCGRSKSWHIKQNSLLSPSQQMELQISNDASINYNYSIYSRPENYRHSEPTSSIQIKKFKQTLSKKQKNVLDNDDSLNISKNEGEQNMNDQNELELFNKYKKPQTIKTFFINKIHFFGSKKNIQIRKQQTKLNTIEQTKKRRKTNISFL
ncbi:unnamed protein product [Rotaria sp. Silwood1]|nr:unnamed protein product [Rotaria sp. Silwood1]CAF1610266.1 unnamed protein product [Rotaria sp. Silwood1]